MCGMALVHSWIDSFVYLKDGENGSVSSDIQLHCMKNLNHSFHVYRVDDLIDAS